MVLCSIDSDFWTFFRSNANRGFDHHVVAARGTFLGETLATVGQRTPCRRVMGDAQVFETRYRTGMVNQQYDARFLYTSAIWRCFGPVAGSTPIKRLAKLRDQQLAFVVRSGVAGFNDLDRLER